MQVISADQLLGYLADILFNIRPDSRNHAQENFYQNFYDATTILKKLRTGIDVNVR